MVEETDDDKDDNAMSSSKPLVIDRIQPSTSQQHSSVIGKIGEDKAPKPSVFQRLKEDKQPKSSVFTRIKGGGQSSSSSPAQAGSLVFKRLGETNEV